ncbi:hypothetical protein JCM30471_04360 [Desulfuromonas carbonis]
MRFVVGAALLRLNSIRTSEDVLRSPPEAEATETPGRERAAMPAGRGKGERPPASSGPWQLLSGALALARLGEDEQAGQ